MREKSSRTGSPRTLCCEWNDNTDPQARGAGALSSRHCGRDYLYSVPDRPAPTRKGEPSSPSVVQREARTCLHLVVSSPVEPVRSSLSQSPNSPPLNSTSVTLAPIPPHETGPARAHHCDDFSRRHISRWVSLKARLWTRPLKGCGTSARNYHRLSCSPRVRRHHLVAIS